MKTLSLVLMVLLYVAAGINHFVNPAPYMALMPPWLPYHKALVAISGVCELLFGLLLIPIALRRFAAWAIIALLIAVFPANIQMMLNWQHDNHPDLWIAILRLPLQLLLIWWAYSFTKRKTQLEVANAW